MFKLGFIGLTEQNDPLLAMTPPPASREVSLRVGHNAALPATGGHSLPRCRFATPRRGSLLPRSAGIRYPTSDSYPRPKAPSPRGLRPQAVGEFTVMGIFTLSNSSTNPNFSFLYIIPKNFFTIPPEIFQNNTLHFDTFVL